jgi:hypothetical protein
MNELRERLRLAEPSPRRVEPPSRWLTVVERDEGQTEVSFTFHLAGIAARAVALGGARPGADGGDAAVDLLAVAQRASDLQSRLSLELRSAAAGRQGTCCIHITSTAASSAEARDRATELWTEMARTLGQPDADYVFEPLVPQDDPLDRPGVRTIRLARRAVAVGARVPVLIGYGQPARPAGARGPVLAPAASRWGHVNQTVRTLQSMSAVASVRFSLERVALTEDEVALLAGTLARLQARPLKAPAGRDLHPAGGDLELVESMAPLLACWATHPAGWRVHADLRATGGEVPAALLMALGLDFDTLAPAEGRPEPIGANTLDLSDLAHERIDMPGLLPPLDRLHPIGIRTVLAGRWRDLPTAGAVIGSLPGANTVPVRLPDDSREEHRYLAGATGTGKSTLLYNLIVQDLAEGHGLCLLDPHGSLFDRVLASIPASRRDEVVVIDPCDGEWVVGLNLLAVEGTDADFERQVAANEVLRIMDRLYDLDRTGGPIFETYIRNAMLLVMDTPALGGTLVEVVRVFENADFRRRLIAACSDPSVVGFWRNVAHPATGEASLTGVTPYVTSKLNQFTQNAFVRPIIGQVRTTISFAEALENGRIVLVNLGAGRLGVQDAHLLGMLVVNGMMRAAFRRDARQARERPMFMYLDEFQYFLTDTAAAALAQARKFGLHLTLAHQHLSQLAHHRLGSQLVDAVLGNAGTKLLFRLGPTDAELLQGWVRPDLTAADLQRLANYDVAACVAAASGTGSPMIVRTHPAMACPYACAPPEAVRAGQARYARRRQAVEAEIWNRLTSKA